MLDYKAFTSPKLKIFFLPSREITLTFMKKIHFFLFLLMAILGPMELLAQATDSVTPLQTIAFGSCNNQEKPQPMWQFVVQTNPDLWIWLGDNIYGDSGDERVMGRKYAKQKNNPEYVKLRHQCEVIGTWDDHDYGLNDGGKEWKGKEVSKRAFHNFFGRAISDPIRKRPGVYDSYTYGEGAQKVKVILLDTRYFRDSLEVRGIARKKFCIPNIDGDILGEAQWQWLEKELSNSDAAINILGTSIQCIPDQHHFEKWANFPQARLRLFNLIKKTQPAKLVLLSGDRHIAEVSRFDLEGLDYPLYEITSSGITHTWSTEREEENPYRLGDLIIKRNFALLRINWEGENPRVLAEVRGLGNELFLQQALDWE